MDKSQTISAPNWTDRKASTRYRGYSRNCAKGRHTDQDNLIGAATRARWLAELGRALDDARRLTAELSASSAFASEVAGIAASVDQAIRQVDWLRRGRPVAIADILGPKWLELSPDCADKSR